MTTTVIRQLFETALAAISPNLVTAFENISFVPTVGVPYQLANVLFATPSNPELSKTFWIELGIFQVTLKYPFGVGSGDINARADLTRESFYRGKAFTGVNTLLKITGTPSVGAGRNDGDRWMVPVKIPFDANCYR